MDYEEANSNTAFDFLGYSEENPNSIFQCIMSARENARTIATDLSRTLEDINTLYHKIIRLRDDGGGLSRFCEVVKRAGIVSKESGDATLPRDEGWHFVQAGCVLDAPEMTARLPRRPLPTSWWRLGHSE